MNYTTTRTHPRTLAQAFPDERAHCIEGPERHPSSAVSIAVAVVIVLIVVLIGLNSSGVFQ
jgi:hypothetical protein